MKAMKLKTDLYQVVIFQLKMFRSRSLTTAAVSRKRSFEEFSVEKEEKIEIATKQKKSRSEAFSDFFSRSKMILSCSKLLFIWTKHR